MTDYPWNLDVRPLTTWPGQQTPHSERRWSPFKAGMRQTLSLLTRELGFLNAQHPVMEVAIPPEKFRIDGKPRADATATHPGVVVSLPKTNVGALRYACDAFYEWQDNLRAIALGLEALRKVERYGITKRGEQYVGFKQLPPGGIQLGAGMTQDEALSIIAEHSGDATGDDDLPTLIRRAKAAAHPDRNDGDRAAWDRVERAIQVLERNP
jgi:hypothetical protein